MATKKIKVKISGIVFELPEKVLQDGYGRSLGQKMIYLTAVSTASLIKQYVKSLKLKDTICWATSSSYSGGSSVSVHLSKVDGSSVSDTIYNKIRTFCDGLRAGDFDGMTDSYNYRGNGVTDNGTPISFGPSFVFVENSPKWDTIQYGLKSISNGESIDNVVKYMSIDVAEKLHNMINK
jgi:hypothetical protein